MFTGVYGTFETRLVLKYGWKREDVFFPSAEKKKKCRKFIGGQATKVKMLLLLFGFSITWHPNPKPYDRIYG